MSKVFIIGLGYVGLPTAIEASQSGHTVHGYDTDLTKMNLLASGLSYIEGIQDAQIKNLVESGDLNICFTPQNLKDIDVVLISVPTPLADTKVPDLTSLLSAAETAGSFLKPDVLVIVESTVEPGTVRTKVLPILSKISGLSQDRIKLVYSPERIDPGNSKWNLKNIPKLVAGINQESTIMAIQFYEKFIDTLVECSSLEVAETAKLLENSFRYVNISFINEVAIYCNKLQISVSEVIAKASSKPYGFMEFYPSVGVGGHCIPVDPLYLSHSARNVGVPTKMIDSADLVNEEVPNFFVNLAAEKINGLVGKKILVVGIAYKPNVSDIRESPSLRLIKGLREKGAEVLWHDDLAEVWNDEKSINISAKYDLAILATAHDHVNLQELGTIPFIDTRRFI